MWMLSTNQGRSCARSPLWNPLQQVDVGQLPPRRILPALLLTCQENRSLTFASILR